MCSITTCLIAVGCFFTGPSSQAADDWPMLGHDPARSGATTARIQPPFARKWYRLFPDEGIQSGVQPVIAGAKVFMGTLAGNLHALDAETGRDVWNYRAGAPILHAAAVDHGRVFFGNADGFIQALNTADGKPLWSFRTEAAVWNAPAVYGDLVFVGSRDGQFLAIEAATGKARWVARLGAPILNSPAVDAKKGQVYVGAEDMRVRAYAIADGHAVWTSERLPGASLRGYHPVIAPDGAVMVTTAPVIGYDHFQGLLLEMVREVFGDFASWRHKKDENARLRAENFRLMEKPETYGKQLDYLRRRLTAEPAFQTFFVLEPATGRQRFVAPIVASESMNGPGAPPLVTPDGRVIVKYQVLLRSRYEHYSPFLNVGYLDTATGHITPIMDQTRTYGWHDSLLLVHDEQCQLSLAGRLLLNTHQDNVNALDLDTLKGFPQPFAMNIHEPARGEAFALRLETWRGHELPPGDEWLMRGTAVYGGGSVLDVPVAIAGDSFYYLPTHELNSGCALIAYRSQPGAAWPKKTVVSNSPPTAEEWQRIQELPWDWDTLEQARLKNLLEALPGKVPGTKAAPLTTHAEDAVAAIPDKALDEFIWQPAYDPAQSINLSPGREPLAARLRAAARELISHPWRPLLTPAGKAPQEAFRFFSDPSQTLYAILLARPFLDRELQTQADAGMKGLAENLPRIHDANQGESRVVYDTPLKLMNVAEEAVLDDLARLYPLWLWSRTPAAKGFLENQWPQFRKRLSVPAGKDNDCGNARLAGLIAFCRMADAMKDQAALDQALPITRAAMRSRLKYEFAHTRGGVIRGIGFARWRHLTPDVARLLRAYAKPINARLLADYVDYQRPGWWIAWNVEQLMRNEVPYQLPSTPLEIFSAKALLQQEPTEKLQTFLDLPWCRADEYYLQKLALTLRADAGSAAMESGVEAGRAAAAQTSVPLERKIYYVDGNHPRASDENAGTETSPWKTLNHAATILRAGDTVLVKAGHYNVGASSNWAVPAVGPKNSGRADAPITFKAYPGHRVMIATSGGQAAIGSNRDYVIWDGFVVDMTDRMKGILIFGARGCVVRYCEVTGNPIASGDNHDGIRIEHAPNCRIEHNVIHGVQGKSENNAGIKVYSKGATNVIVEDNYIYGNTAGVFDKDFGVDNTYRRNYFTRNGTDFYGNNQGGLARYYIYDNVFDGRIELHADNRGTEIHDNLVRSGVLAGAWAGGVTEVKVWNNIVLSKGRSIMACQNKKQDLASALAYLDYNLYDAPPAYDFGEYTASHQRLSLDQMRGRGFEAHSQVVPGSQIFQDEKFYRLFPQWKTAGRQADAPGPDAIGLVLDLSRYGPAAARDSASLPVPK